MKSVSGDLLKMAENNEYDVIVHGCNCFNTMGAGIAAQIRDKFPEAYQTDCATVKGDYSKMGGISVTSGFPRLQGTPAYGLTVVNAYTQYKYWEDRKTPSDLPLVSYNAIEEAFKKIKKEFGGKNLRFGIPKIGAGLAGGNWDIIAFIIDTIMEGEDVTLVNYVAS